MKKDMIGRVGEFASFDSEVRKGDGDRSLYEMTEGVDVARDNHWVMKGVVNGLLEEASRELKELAVMGKSQGAGEKSGHKYKGRKPKPGGGFIYEYEHEGGGKYEVHEGDKNKNSDQIRTADGKVQSRPVGLKLKALDVRETLKKIEDDPKAASHYGAGDRKKHLENVAKIYDDMHDISEHHRKNSMANYLAEPKGEVQDNKSDKKSVLLESMMALAGNKSGNKNSFTREQLLEALNEITGKSEVKKSFLEAMEESVGALDVKPPVSFDEYTITEFEKIMGR